MTEIVQNSVKYVEAQRQLDQLLEAANDISDAQERAQFLMNAVKTLNDFGSQALTQSCLSPNPVSEDDWAGLTG